MGLGGIDDLPNEHRNVLQIEHLARLAPILDMVETTAGQNAACRSPRTTARRSWAGLSPSTTC